MHIYILYTRTCSSYSLIMIAIINLSLSLSEGLRCSGLACWASVSHAWCAPWPFMW